MTRLFRSKSCGLVGVSEFDRGPPSPLFHRRVRKDDGGGEEESESDEDEIEEESDSEEEDDENAGRNPVSTPFMSRGSRFGGGKREGQSGNSANSSHNNNNQYQIVDFLVAALRKSLITCSVERDDVSSMDISWPTEVRHVSHVTFDRFNGFLGLPTELEPDLPRKVPSARSHISF